MDNSIEITLKDADTEEEFKLRLSPTSAFKAETDLNFATLLLNVARQSACFDQKSACSGTERTQATISYDTSLEETSDDMYTSASQEQSEKETKEDEMEDPLLENKENFRWSHEAIMLLVEEYRLRESSMSSGKISQKKAWDNIAAIMNNKGYNVSGRQCMTRINTMKRTYKTIKDHNSKSGNNKRTWKYYEVMESFLNEKPYMTPLMTISSTGSITSKRSSPSASSNASSSASSSSISTCQSYSRKRKVTDVMEKLMENHHLAEEAKERRHKEKIEIKQKLLEKLDKFMEKL